MKKKILILLIPFLLTGCASVNYELDIDKNINVSEKVKITATSDFFNIYYKNLPITIVKEFYNDSDIQNKLNNNNYKHEINQKNTKYPEVIVSKEYKSLEEYSQNTIFKNQVFENVIITTNDNLITLQTVNFKKYTTDDDSDSYPVSKLAISIKSPYVVVENNADKHDKKTNAYIWLVDSSTENKEIKITFDKNKIYIYNIIMYISLFVIILIILTMIIIGFKMHKKNVINNEI